jgi:4-amino-4-deoxy-L-arabinose transferase-like glycosyltransferase
MLTLPQVLYLASRNITFTGGLFAWHRDEIMYGSGHNPSVPGNFGIHDQAPWSNAIYTQPLAQALLWGVSIATVTFMLCRERRAQGLAMFAFYIVCALAFMAKGIPGFALPGLVAFLYLLTCSRFSMLLSGKLRIAAGALTLTTVGMPWFVAMFIRHGKGFTDRILVHDHINRLTTGVHGDKGSVQYFIQQLGYGMFPWFALLPAALAGFVAFYARSAPAVGERNEQSRQQELLIVLGLWFIATFTLFSAMTTKFHHYIFPAVPPASILIGLLLDRMLGERRWGRRQTLPAAVLAVLAPLPLVLGVAGLFGDVRGVLPAELGMAQRALWSLQHKWPLSLCVGFIAVGLAALSIGLIALRRVKAREARQQARGDVYVDAGAGSGARASEGHGALGAALIAGALVVAFIGRDLSWVTAERPAGYERLIHLFVYNYERPWPEQFDYRAILSGFAVVATTLVLGTAIRALRPVLTLAFVGVATLFSLWCLDVYMIDLSPHWGQQELVERYYKERKDAKEPLVAWQMNWKGENFYSGNRVAVFVSLNNKELEEWLKKNKGKRAFFLLEHKRLDRLKRALGARKVETRSTERENNKFVLVRTIL